MTASVFKIRNVHGHYLGLQRSTGYLVSCLALGSSDLAEAVLSRTSESGDVAMITSAESKPCDFRIGQPSRALPVQFISLSARDEKWHCMFGPRQRQFITSPPIAPNEHAAMIHVGTSIALEWEMFSLEVMSSIFVHPDVRSRFEHGMQARNALSSTSGFMDVLGTNKIPGPYLDAALQMAPTAVLDEVASLLLRNPQSAEKLRQLFPSDPWAQSALPELARWRAARLGDEPAPPERPRWFGTLRREKAPIANKPHYETRAVIGRELDLLGAAGYAGQFVTTPRALTVRARRTIAPSRRCAVLATARNEGVYLLEFIAYYQGLGVEHFSIYSNDNEDDSDHLLGALADAGVIRWVSSHIDPQVGNAQNKAYGHALNFSPELLDYQWTLVVDMDEFLTIDPLRYASIIDFCNWHAELGADTVAINWQFMAPSENGDVAGLLTRRNTHVLSAAQMGEGTRLVKSMSRTNRISHSEPHVPIGDERSALHALHASGRPHSWHNPPTGFAPGPMFADNVDGGAAVVNHYFYKSAAEWLWKCSRNRGDHRLRSAGELPMIADNQMHEFIAHMDVPGLKEDNRAVRCSPAIAGASDRLRALPGVAEAARRVENGYHARLARIREHYRELDQTTPCGPQQRTFLALAGVWQ